MSKSILIIDDDVDIRHLLLVFEDEGFIVSDAGSDKDAVKQLEERAPDLILLTFGWRAVD